MSFSQDNGYTPQTFLEIIEFLRAGVNAQFGTSFTTESFVGTNWYKYFYTLAQKVLLNETKTSEIFQKIQQYIELTNEAIQRPSVSAPGLLDSFQDEGFIVSVKPPNNTDAGKVFICALLDNADDDYAEKKLQVCTLIKDFIAGGIVSQGAEVESITLSNGQSFDFKFDLPEETPLEIEVTIAPSENTLLSVPTDEQIRQIVFDNIKARYRLGWNFEPQRYFNLSDAPWAESVVVEWSDDSWSTSSEAVIEAEFDDLFTVDLEDISVVIT
jgi:hypothetical protein